MNDFDLMVLEFIKESGATGATLTQTLEGTYNPSTGTVATTTNVYPIECILTDLTLKSDGLSVKYGTLVEAGDKELYLRPPHKTNGLTVPIAISPASDRVTVAGVTYRVMDLKEVNPTGADPLFISLYLRR